MALSVKQLKDILGLYRKGLEAARGGRAVAVDEIRALSDDDAQRRYKQMGLSATQVRDYTTKQEREARLKLLAHIWDGEPLGQKMAKLLKDAAAVAEQRQEWSREAFLLRARFAPKEKSEDTQRELLGDLLEETRRARIVSELRTLTGEQLQRVGKEASGGKDWALLHATQGAAKALTEPDAGLTRAALSSIVAQANMDEVVEAAAVFDEIEKISQEVKAIDTWFQTGSSQLLSFFDFEKKRLEEKAAQGNGNAEPPAAA